VTLALPPENPPRDLRTVGGRNPLTGAKVENVSPATAIELQIDPLSKGVAVVEVGNSIASNYGFQPGDIIESINGVHVNNVSGLLRALDGTNRWQLVIMRNGQRLTLSAAR
jgi:serine protease Do